MATLRLNFPVHGDVLSRHDGKETAQGLAVTVKGQSAPGADVRINGVPAKGEGDVFSGDVLLKERTTDITVAAGEGNSAISATGPACGFALFLLLKFLLFLLLSNPSPVQIWLRDRGLADCLG